MEKLNAAIEQVEGIKREHGRYTLEEAALFIGKQTGERAEGIKNKLIAAVEKRELVTYAPGSFVKNDSKIIRDFYEHVYWKDLNEWLGKNEQRLVCTFPDPDPDAPADKVEAVLDTTRAQVTQNKLRRNNLDPAIDKAIKQAKNMELADVYLELKELALAGEKPFTGALDSDALCYTNDNNKPAKLTKDALGKRLKKRR